MALRTTSFMLLATTATASFTLPKNLCEDPIFKTGLTLAESQFAALKDLKLCDPEGIISKGFQCAQILKDLAQDEDCTELGGFLMTGVEGQTSAKIEALCSNACFPKIKPALDSANQCVSDLIGGLSAENQKLLESVSLLQDKIDTAFTGKLGKQIDFMCSKNPSDPSSFCVNANTFDLVVKLSKDLKAGDATSTSVCPALQDAGCCAASILAAYVPDQIVKSAGEAAVKKCGWASLPSTCPAEGVKIDKVLATFDFPKFDFSKFEGYDLQKQLEVKLAMAKDLAAKLNIDLAQIDIGDLKASITSGVSLKLAVLPKDLDLDTLKQKVIDAIKSNTWTNTQEAVPAEDRGSAAMQASEPAAETERAELAAGSAGSLTPSIAALGMAMYLAVAL